MTLAELIKEVETAAAEATCGEIHGNATDDVHLAAFSVTANLDEEGKVSVPLAGNTAATVKFNVVKEIKRVKR